MTNPRTPLMAGNWKMTQDHHEAVALVQKLAWELQDAKHDYDSVEVAVIPPFTDIRSVQTLVEGDKLGLNYGAQDVSAHEKGAYTGEVSPVMLSKLGVTYALVGHSERRQYHDENEETSAAKIKSAFSQNIVPILCVGEGLDIRKAGDQVSYTLAQIDGALNNLPVEQAKRIVIAYEPVWAIGTGEVATPEDAQEVCAAIRAQLAKLYNQEVADAVRVLYGGSVKSGNVASIMAQADVDGALVGGASTDGVEFAKIVRYQDHVN